MNYFFLIYLSRKIKTNETLSIFHTYTRKKEEKGRRKISKAVIHRSFHMTNVHFKQTLNGHFVGE